MDRLYALVFDRDESINFVGLHNFIRDAPGITNWWHYIKSMYILRTAETPASLRDQFRPYFGGNHFLVYELAPPNSEGRLSPKAWAWIQKQETELGRSQD